MFLCEVEVVFQKFGFLSQHGCSGAEEKMTSTLKLYAKIQAAQGLFMTLMPYQAALLVGYDK